MRKTDISQLEAFNARLAAAPDLVPALMKTLVLGEGVYAVRRAKWLCKNLKPDAVNTGNYRNNWHSGTEPIRNGSTYKIDVYNNTDYASFIEHGFRSHFVPGEWRGNSFVYIKGAKTGMYVGPYKGFVRGRHILSRAIEETKATQEARLARKQREMLAKIMGPEKR